MTTLPSSNALAEASGQDTIAELLARDPAKMSDADFDRLIELEVAEFNRKREAWKSAEGVQGAKRPTKALPEGSADDLGI